MAFQCSISIIHQDITVCIQFKAKQIVDQMSRKIVPELLIIHQTNANKNILKQRVQEMIAFICNYQYCDVLFNQRFLHW